MTYNYIHYKVGDIIGVCAYVKDAPCPESFKKNKTRHVTLTCTCGDQFDTCLSKAKTRNSLCSKCVAKNVGKWNATHAASRSKEYSLWVSMKERCSNPVNKTYPHYGGRGISVHAEWVNDFPKFLKDIGYAPTPKHSLDRINNDGNYEPSNVRWATMKTQCRNRSSNFTIQYQGNKITLKDLEDITGVAYHILYHRIANQGYSIERAISQKVRHSQKLLLLDTKTGIFYEGLSEASFVIGLSTSSISRYIHNKSKNPTSLILV